LERKVLGEKEREEEREGERERESQYTRNINSFCFTFWSFRRRNSI